MTQGSQVTKIQVHNLDLPRMIRELWTKYCIQMLLGRTKGHLGG